MRFLKIFALLAALLLTLGCFAACKDEPEPVAKDVYYTVTFKTAGGGEIPSIRVLSGSRIAEPDTPERQGFIFNGWMNGTVKWNFDEDTVNSDITLVASWINAKTQFEYEVSDGEIVITGYKGSESSVVIPRFIDGVKVTAIGEGAFSDIKPDSITDITVGDNILTVGKSAFEGCSGVKIIFEGEILSLGEKAFFGCDALESIALGSGVSSVPYATFSGCTSLETVSLADGVKIVEENAFEGCSSLIAITAHPTLERVADSAFLDCKALESVYYYGTEDDWSNTEIATGNGGNDSLIGAELYIYSENEPEEDIEDKYWYIDDNGNKRLW